MKTAEVLRKLNYRYVMKNDKQIAITELSFQIFSGKYVTIVQYPKPISRNV